MKKEIPFTTVPPGPHAAAIERHIRAIHREHPALTNLEIAYKVQDRTQKLSPATGGCIIAAEAVERVLAGQRL